MQKLRVIFLALGLLNSGACALTYTVKAGDTLFEVARAYGMDPADLARQNKLTSSTIQVGQKLQVSGGGPAADSAQGKNSQGKAASAAQDSPTPQENNTSGVVRTAATRFLGLRYRIGASGIGGVDCSGFTRAVLSQMGVALPRTAREQFNMGRAVARRDLQPGDLVFFNTTGRGVSHVGVYLGGGQFAHANSYVGRSVVDSLDQLYYRYRYVGARRVLPNA